MRQQLVALAALCALTSGACGDDNAGKTKVPLFVPNVCCHGADVAPATYASPPWFAPKLVMDVGPGWRSVNAGDFRLFALGQGRNDLQDMSRNVYFFTVPPSHTTLLVDLARMPGVQPDGPSKPATLAGLPARQLDAVAAPDPTVAEDRTLGVSAKSRALPVLDRYVVASGFHVITATAGPRLRFLVAPVRSQLLLVMIEAPPKEFAAFAAEASRLLATLKFPT